MFEQGQIKSPKMVAPLSHEDMVSASPVLEANKEVESWFKREM